MKITDLIFRRYPFARQPKEIKPKPSSYHTRIDDPADSFTTAELTVIIVAEFIAIIGAGAVIAEIIVCLIKPIF